jgi:excisionase family DNA binding protein
VRFEFELNEEQLAATVAKLVDERLAEHHAGYLDVKGAAEFLACEPGRIYALNSAGRIPSHRDGSRLLFDRAELREWVRNGGRGDRDLANGR